MSETLKTNLTLVAGSGAGAASPSPFRRPAPALRLIDGDRDPANPRSILIVLEDFASDGTRRAVVQLANAWAKSGRAVTIFAAAADGPLVAMVNAVIPIVQPARPIVRGRGSSWRLAAAVARHLRQVPADACFVPDERQWPVAAMVSRLPLAVRPVVVAQIAMPLESRRRGGAGQWLQDIRMRMLLGKVDATAAPADPVRSEADRVIGGRRAATMMLPVLDSRVARPAAVHMANQRIVAAGQLVPENGFDTLIRAFALMCEGGRHPTAELVIVGEGPDRFRLAALAIGLGISGRLYMPGYVPDIRPWLDVSRLFVLPSRPEGFPAAIVEALAAGRPVVAADGTPMAAQLLPDLTAGRVVPAGDAAAMAQAMAAALSAAPADPSRLAASVDRYRLAPVAQHYLALFDRLDTARRAGAQTQAS